MKPSNTISIDFLRKQELFHNLNLAALEVLLKGAYFEYYEKNEVVVPGFTVVDSLYWVLEGLMAYYIRASTDEGLGEGFAEFRPGQVFGGFIMYNEVKLPPTLAASTAVKVIRIPKQSVTDAMKADVTLPINMMRNCTSVLKERYYQMLVLGQCSTTERVALQCLRETLPDGEGGRYAKNLPRNKDLAVMAQTSQESVSRMLRQLEADGLIVREVDKHKHGLIIPSEARFCAYLCESVGDGLRLSIILNILFLGHQDQMPILDAVSSCQYSE